VKHLREFPNPPNLDQNEGVKAMRSEMEKENLYPPIFLSYPTFSDSVKVVLFNEKIATEWEKVQSFLEKNTFITNEEARQITHIEQRDRMSKLLKQWVDKSLLIQIIPETGYMR
jgi:predicted HTH transcriptional regulator